LVDRFRTRLSVTPQRATRAGSNLVAPSMHTKPEAVAITDGNGG